MSGSLIRSSRLAVAPDYDDRKFLLDASTARSFGEDGEDSGSADCGACAEPGYDLTCWSRAVCAPKPATQLVKEDWQRWNDYGIGLLLQGDLKAAQAAFEKVTEIDPQNPDGWVNIGRAALQEGDVPRARTVLDKALAIDPKLARANFFYASLLKLRAITTGRRRILQIVLAQYPRDRVALNNLGRVFFLQRKYADAVKDCGTGAGDRSGRSAGALQSDALLQRSGRREHGQGTPGAVSAFQSR